MVNKATCMETGNKKETPPYLFVEASIKKNEEGLEKYWERYWEECLNNPSYWDDENSVSIRIAT